MKKVTIELTENQLYQIREACEFTSRFLAGQIDSFSLLSALQLSYRASNCDQAFFDLKKALFPELRQGESYSINSSGQAGDEGIVRARQALYDIYRTIYEFQVDQKKEAGEDVGHNVYCYKASPVGEEPKPIIKLT